jgi:hypothetical protein
MKLYTKQHQTEIIPTTHGMFVGLHKNQSTRNLGVGDFFVFSDSYPNLLVFIQKNWEKIWFLGLENEIISNEIEYNVLTDTTNVIKSTTQFTNLYNQEISNLKQQVF